MSVDTVPVRLVDVSKTFKRSGSSRELVHAVADVSLEVRAGEVVALVGQSGSGKSTIARLLMGLEQPTTGEVIVEGQPVSRMRSARRRRAYYRRVQMVFQDPFASLNPAHTVEYALKRPLRNFGDRRLDLDQRLADLMDSVGLDRVILKRHPHELSGGQRQRVAVARALAAGPRVLIADEPTSMLDVSIRLEILNLLLDLREEVGFTMIYITHDLASARFLADRIMVMRQGRIVESGDTEDLLANPQDEYTRRLLKAVPDPASSIRRRQAAAAPEKQGEK